MAIIGFILTFCLGLSLVIWSVLAAFASSAFSGKLEIGFVITTLIGAYILVIAVENAPFTITFQ
jgi:hypothetical protein